ncbi:DUF4183 domain-containing protein [Psychrobacillus sp.]|uniref:DUF4183 domain-containing protein n=1 Tax=Psychrobacillus sp. TaxID=1871623 RepID=UPI0028BF1E04|nr:DUF4183 domain-containing protein [Psychrobacillus sp.]
MKNQPYVPHKTNMYFPKPLIIPLTVNRVESKVTHLKEASSHEFFVLSDGNKRIYTESDALSEYGIQKILDPSTVSYMNLFINGILQPKVNYEVTEGKIVLLTEDIPSEECPIILQMITI